MKISVRWLAAAAASLLAIPSLSSAAETVKIGAAFSLTGNAAAYGAQQKSGVLQAIDDVNKSGKLKGIMLELVLEDDGTSKEQGIAVFQRFINRDKVSARRARPRWSPSPTPPPRASPTSATSSGASPSPRPR
jgi:branched-chain amino acid transport system substrate-binding protein